MSFKNKFASLVQELRNKKSREFSRQPQPAYSSHFAEAPPPPPPIPDQYKKKSSSESQQKVESQPPPPPANTNARPPSRSGSIRAGLKKIGSRTSLRELRRKSSFAGKSTTSVNNYGLQNESQSSQPQRQNSTELTPPPSGGKGSPPPPISTSSTNNQSENQYTPPQGNFDDSDDDLYSDPVKDKLKAEGASKTPKQLASPPPEPTQSQPQSQNGPPQRPQMFIPRTNSNVLPTIPASPASIMGPSSPIGGTNPFRKFGPATPNLSDVSESGPFKPASPELPLKPFEPPRLNTVVPPATENEDRISPVAVSPTTATKGLMSGLNYVFAPPPTEAAVPPAPVSTPPPQSTTPPTSAGSSPSAKLADNNPFKDLVDDPYKPNRPAPPPPTQIRAVAPPSDRRAQIENSFRGPPKAPSGGPPAGQPKYKRAPSGKAAAPEGFAPPPPPPMALPKGWTAKWDEKEGKFAYYQGTRSRTEQWDLPTEPAKKLSMRDRRIKKKKDVQDTIAGMQPLTEATSPTTESHPVSNTLVAPNVSS